MAFNKGMPSYIQMSGPRVDPGTDLEIPRIFRLCGLGEGPDEGPFVKELPATYLSQGRGHRARIDLGGVTAPRLYRSCQGGQDHRQAEPRGCGPGKPIQSHLHEISPSLVMRSRWCHVARRRVTASVTDRRTSSASWCHRLRALRIRGLSLPRRGRSGRSRSIGSHSK